MVVELNKKVSDFSLVVDVIGTLTQLRSLLAALAVSPVGYLERAFGK